MIADLQPYAEMRELGVPWLAEVPAHWEVRKLRRILTRVTERERPELPLLSVVRERGVIRRDTTIQDENHNYIPDDLSNYKVVRVGQFAMNKMKAWQGSYGVSRHEGIVSPAYFVFDVSGLDGTFFHTAIRSKSYVSFFTQASDGVRIGQWDLADVRMREIPFLVPPPSEQADIVRFLDHADRRIRRYIAAKRRLIALLNEQKQATINNAVTRGLNPDVRLKPSGVEWLGDVPEHWEVRKIGAIAARVTKGTTPTTLGRSFTDAGIRFVKVESISKDRRLLPPLCAYIDSETDTLLARSRLRAGDVLVAIAGAIGRVAVAAEEDLPANCNQAVAIVSPVRSSVLPDWLAFALASPACQRFLADSSVQSAQANLSLADLRGTMIPVPSVPEQGHIVGSLVDSTAAIADAAAFAEREIGLLVEYRTRLIADVVTGKLDVRDAVAQLPDETEEPEPLDLDEALASGDGLENEADLDGPAEQAEA